MIDKIVPINPLFFRYKRSPVFRAYDEAGRFLFNFLVPLTVWNANLEKRIPPSVFLFQIANEELASV